MRRAEHVSMAGVKMGATVRVNGRSVGVLRDQFLRYVFTLDAAELGLVAGANRLDVTFGLGDVAEDGRFMACTGGWDWACRSPLFPPVLFLLVIFAFIALVFILSFSTGTLLAHQHQLVR